MVDDCTHRNVTHHYMAHVTETQRLVNGFWEGWEPDIEPATIGYDFYQCDDCAAHVELDDETNTFKEVA